MLSHKIHKSQVGKTPQGNTGVNSTNENAYTFCIDWLQGTFPTKHITKILSLANKALGFSEFIERPSGIRYFNRSYKHPSGAIAGVGRKLPSGDIDESLSYLELSATALSYVPQKRLRKLFKILSRKFDFNPTRLDLTIDDHSKGLDISKVKRAADKNYYTGFRDTVKFYEKGRRGSKGMTISFGSRGSAGGGKHLNIYDKDLESKGLIKSIRIELSLYDIYVKQAFEDLSESPLLLWSHYIKGWILGSIDFRKRKSKTDKNPGRAPRLKWWDKIFNDAVVIKPARNYKPNNLEKIKNWMRVQLAPSLAVLFHANFQQDEQNSPEFWAFIWELLFNGDDRLKSKHYWLINSA